MAVQIPDPGTGNGQTGDNEYVFRKKVKDNFTDQANAASKLVGTATGQIPVFNHSDGLGGTGWGTELGGAAWQQTKTLKENMLVKGIKTKAYSTSFADDILLRDKVNNGGTVAGTFMQVGYDTTASSVLFFPIGTPNIYFGAQTGTAAMNWKQVIVNGANSIFGSETTNAPNVVVLSSGELRRSTSIAYTDTNTTKDSNGFIKAASPIVKVFSDNVELNGEAVDQDVSYKKNGVGDYTITTVSGLSTDGWYIELPKDMNGNPKVAVTLEETDGVISLKTYKRIFSMETFTFEPDLEHPLDIPDGRWIDLRLNEIPVEPSEPESEV